MIDQATRIADRYRIDARLGGGGMADVFDAHDEMLDRPVALKLLRGIDEAGAARRFAEEIRLTARVNHPNIVALYDAGEHDGSPFLVLERVTGGTLAGEMADGPLEPSRVASVGEQLASALSHSHAAGIVHRDVKPSNILLTDDRNVRLADFGIAVTATATRLTVTGTIAGSAGYVSPEQVLGTGAGAASDIYALGLVLLECLTGAPPWSGTTVEVALARITADPPIPKDLPEGWEPLLRAMTAREPEDRPAIDTVGYALSRLALDDTYDKTVFLQPSAPADRRVPAVAGMSLAVLLAAAFVTLTSQAPTPMAVAASAPSVNISVADSVLQPAVLPSASPALADRATRRATAQRRTTRAPQNERAAAGPKRTAPRAVATSPGSGDRGSDAGTSAPAAPAGDTGVKLPKLKVPSVPKTATSVNVPKADDVISDPVDTVDRVVKPDPVEPVEPVTDELTRKEKAALRRSAKANKSTGSDREIQRTIDNVIESLGKKNK